MSAPAPAGIGLACAGGVVEGAFYEIGVLCALDDFVEGLDLNALDIYVGVSAGAILTACLANGIPPRAIARALLSGEGAVDSLSPDQVFVPAWSQYARRAARVPDTVLRAVAKHLARPRDISWFGALMELSTALPVGLFDNRPLERHLAKIFAQPGRTNDFRELTTELRIVAVDLDSAELVAFGDAPTAHVAISRAVQASTALPLLYCPVRIGGRDYIDGVARKTVNASQALAAGVGLLLTINPIVPIDLRFAHDGTHNPHLVQSGLPAVLSQTFRTMIHSRRLAGFRNYVYAYPDVDVLMIEPEPGDLSMFYTNIFSFENRHDVLEHGYATTRGYLLREADRIDRVLTRHGLRLRRDALRSPAPLLPPPDDRSTGEVLDDAHATLARLERALARLGAPGASAAGAAGAAPAA